MDRRAEWDPPPPPGTLSLRSPRTSLAPRALSLHKYRQTPPLLPASATAKYRQGGWSAHPLVLSRLEYRQLSIYVADHGIIPEDSPPANLKPGLHHQRRGPPRRQSARARWRGLEGELGLALWLKRSHFSRRNLSLSPLGGPSLPSPSLECRETGPGPHRPLVHYWFVDKLDYITSDVSVEIQ